MLKSKSLLITLLVFSLVFVVGTGVMAADKHGGTLRIGQTTDIRNTDITDIGQANDPLYRQICDTLITESKDGTLTPQPMLATSWEWNEDKTRLRLHLRKGVKFHSGREFKAEDVIKNIEYVQTPENGSKLKGTMSSVIRMDAVDDYTLDLYLDEFNPALFDTFTMLWILDPETLGSKHPGGTGPFEWVEWIPGDHVTLNRFADYWDGDLPYLDKIVLKAVPDAQTLIANLESGALDIAKFVPQNELDRLQDDSRFKVLVSKTDAHFYGISFNCEDEILGNKKVRQALAYSMNRSRFVDTFLYGFSTPQSVLFSRQSTAYDPEYVDHFKFDLDKAKELLKEAGYENGFSTSIMVAPKLDEALLKFALMWQQDLKKIGVNLRINQVERAVWKDNKTGFKFPKILADLYGRAQKEPVSMLTQSLPFLPDGNPARFVSEKYQELVKQAGSEPDKDKRTKIYAEINQLLLEQAFEVPLAPQTRSWLMTKDVKGFDYTIDEFDVLRSTWLDK